MLASYWRRKRIDFRKNTKSWCDWVSDRPFFIAAHAKRCAPTGIAKLPLHRHAGFAGEFAASGLGVKEPVFSGV